MILTAKNATRSLFALFGAILLVLSSTSAQACNIPVFRYALERWQADPVELLIFHRDALSKTDADLISSLKTAAKSQGGHANLEVITRQLDEIQDAELKAVWENLSEQEQRYSPFAVLRARTGRAKSSNVWQGKLKQLQDFPLLNSPVRTELSERLLSGDSVVWLVLASDDEEQTNALVQMLEETLPNFAKEISIPEGIGLPGSELFSPIPLEIHFSVLVINPEDKKERLLKRWMTNHSAQADAAVTPLVVPVFGRGRAIEILSADVVSPSLVRELSIFLSGACSCQLKELNPGFDLLMNVNWERELFGEEPPAIPDPLRTQQDQLVPAILVNIPPGSDEQIAVPSIAKLRQPSLSPVAASKSIQSQNHSPILNHRLDFLLIMFIAIVVFIVAVFGMTQRKRTS